MGKIVPFKSKEQLLREALKDVFHPFRNLPKGCFLAYKIGLPLKK